MEQVGRRKEVALILRRLADLIEHDPSLDVASLLGGFHGFELTTDGRHSKKRQPLFARPRASIEEIVNIEAALKNAPTREDGERMLREKAPTKAHLETLAKALQIPVQRDDTIDKLRTKIIEASIGSRLRSSAIQGTDRLFK